jgi:hypothetical protein
MASALYAKAEKANGLLQKIKDVFRRYQSQPVNRVVQLINPILRGWVNYFAVGHSSERFSFIKDWVEKKIRRRRGLGIGGASVGRGGVDNGFTMNSSYLMAIKLIACQRRKRHQHDRSHKP